MKITRHTAQPSVHSASDKRLTVGFLTTNIIEPWEQLAWHGCLDAAREHDVNLICFPGHQLIEREFFEIQANIVYDLAARTHRLDGVVIWFDEEQKHALIPRFASLPIVGIDDMAGPEIPAILMDHYQSMRQVLMHLIQDHGYRKIAFIRGPEYHHGIRERYRAYLETLAEYGVPVDSRLTYVGRRETLQREELAVWLLDTLSADIDAVVGHNDYVALLAQEALQQRGVRVPEEIAVVGFDDIAEGHVVSPALTTVHPPFYNMGYTAVQTLLQRIAGQQVPKQILLHGTVVNRESCGCIAPHVARAAIHTMVSDKASASFRTLVEQQRVQCLEEIGKIHPQGAMHAAQLFENFVVAVEQKTPENFLESLRNMLRRDMLCELPLPQTSPTAWHDIMSLLRRHVSSCCTSQRELLETENLGQQSRIIIGEIMERAERSQLLRMERRNDALRRLGARLITTFDIQQLLNVLQGNLPSLDFPSLYLVLYDPDADAETPRTAPEWSRMMLAYHDTEATVPQENLSRFPSRQLLPDTAYPSHRQYAFVMEPLSFKEQQIGFAMFETGVIEGKIYEALREELSSALQGALLVQRVREHAAEVARQQYILDTFMETVPDSIYFKDRDSRIIRANSAHANHLGFATPEEEVGTTDFDVFPESQARIRYEQEQHIIHTGEPLINLEEKYEPPDGQPKWALTTKMPLRDEHGRIIGTFGISRNITQLKQAEQELHEYREHLQEMVVQRTAELTRINTLLNEEIMERRRAEQALRLSERQYRMLAENVMEGVAIVLNGRLTVVNEAFTAMLGYSVDELSGREMVPLFPDHEHERVRACLIHRDDALPVPPWQAEILDSDGSLVWIAVSQARIVWENQPALVLTIRNIQASKLREQQLEQERQRLQQENLTFKSTLSERYKFGEIVGKSPVMQRIYELIVNAATSEVNVLVVGESGTGKELIAQTIHQVSSRKQHHFVAVNCASIPDTLFEREFFGHRKGSFTGADRDRAGLFDQAHKGTLFLDEVTELSPGTQAKLLRVLQNGEYLPVGSTIPKKADVVIIAATNKDWKTLTQQGLLREDFFYRICVVEIQVPALRERKDDVPLLIEHILEQYRRKQEKRQGRSLDELPRDQSALPAELVQALYAYHWPGNIRELQNILQRFLVTHELAPVLKHLGTAVARHAAQLPADTPFLENTTLSEAVKAFEKRIIIQLLAQHQNHTGEVADVLGITRRALQYKIKAYGLRKSFE